MEAKRKITNPIIPQRLSSLKNLYRQAKAITIKAMASHIIMHLSVEI